uniref:Fibronectin type III domain containing 7a n=1 Tax=Stegastes partitus TaxID=144197 RepID=A0A3B5BI80_9TELE
MYQTGFIYGYISCKFLLICLLVSDSKSWPQVPSIEKAYSKNSDSITVEFTEVAGATGYILRAESKSGDFFSETSVSGSPGTVMELQPYTDYILSVISVNAWRRSQPSLPVEIRTVVMAPVLEASSPTNVTINVTWPRVEHAVFYTLCIIQEGSSIRLKRNTTDTMTVFDNLEPGTRYCIKGTAWDSEGRTGDDNTVCQITRPSSPNVTLVTVTQGRSLGITVHWLSVQGADVYVALTSNGQNCSSVNRQPSDNHCYIIPAECGQSRSVTVIAYNKAGPSSPSDPFNYITCGYSTHSSPGNCSVMWDDVPLVEHYVAYIKRDDGAEESCNTTETTCQFFCMCGYTYLTSVIPYNHAGSSPYAHVRNYTTIPCCPHDVTIKLVSTETLEIMWSPVRGSELYKTTAAETYGTVHCNDTSPVCALSDLRCNTAYSVTVTPCSELQGCNSTCTAQRHETAPCTPEILDMKQISNSTYKVLISTPNKQDTNYTITATGHYDRHTCHTAGNYCELTQLPCGSTYEVVAVATSAAGKSLPGFSKPLETGPCCPMFVNVSQVTQAMTNMTWSPGHGARSYIAALTSPRGHAKCHTLDTHCLMGCITCGTNYSVHLEAISSSGHKSEYITSYNKTCILFVIGACCPTGVKLYRKNNNFLRVYWRSSGPQVYNHTVELYGTKANNTCMAAAGSMHCDMKEGPCGEVYTVVVAPVGHDGVKVILCQARMYSVPCPGSNAGMRKYHLNCQLILRRTLTFLVR